VTAMWQKAMWCCRFSRTSSVTLGTSDRKRPATEISASCGHGWNQSMTVLLMSAGNWRARIRNLSPTGEKQSTTCRNFRTWSMKKSHRFSGESMMPA